MNLNKLNESKIIKIAIICATSLISLFIIATFAKYYSIKLNFTNPLIPESLVEAVQLPYLIKGMILLCGTIVIFILRRFKQNLYALLIAILLITYYVFSNHFIGGWNTQIN